MSWAQGEVTLNNKVYIATVSTKEFDSRDEELFVRYGEPLVELGGEFTNGDLTFTRDPSSKRIKSHSPFRATFDTDGDEEAGDKAQLFVTTIIERAKIKMADLRLTDSTSYKGTTSVASI